MSIDQIIPSLKERVLSHSDSMQTEEAVKTAVVLPFFQSLGYDVFNPSEVVPEFTADVVGKKGEKVDYAIKIDGEVSILVECKALSVELNKSHLAQLFRYFTVTNAKFAILTNGRVFQFYSDLEAPNKLDTRPFLVIDLGDPSASSIGELRKFEKSSFDVEGILENAERLKYTSALKSEIKQLIDNPSQELVRLVASSVHEGKFTASVIEQYTSLVRGAFKEVIRESVKDKLSHALADTEETISPDPVNSKASSDSSSEIVTTEEEIEGYMIVRAILAETFPVSRVKMRDQKSYCGILADDNNRKPLARLHFNRTSVKYLGLFDGDVEEKIKIEATSDIYKFRDRLKATAEKYE
ncbi:type I restriction endonuclease [Epibacterium ulvae]|uniref:type I restriction endonuclease n=1 Tax=Epibacterium ulvae TaxID=1156985 RepID=UPI0024927C58|nr:type I restriction endonuclease [Epibacterium ulvae]